MRGTRGFVTAVLFAACLCFSPPFSQAWEFELAGSFNWTYEFYGQSGNKGFFGPYNIDNGGGTLAGNLNFWNGGQFDTNITSGSQARWSYFNVELFPKFQLNPAIRLQGKYRLGTYGNPVAPDYHTFDAPGINNAFSEGQWTMFWGTAQTPLGILAVGKRPWTFGTGLQYDGEDAGSTESLALTAPYGPFDIGIAIYPYRYAGSSSIAAFSGYDPFVGGVAPFDPFDVPTYTTPGGAAAVPGQYYSRADAAGSPSLDFLVFLNYHGGPVNIGAVGSFVTYHIGPEAVLQDPADPLPAPAIVAQDSELFHGSAYLKYNNGRFFMNAESAWLYWNDRFHSDPNAVIGAPHTRYTEQWRHMVEAGAVCGPSKISFLGAWTPGPDRRAGTLIDRQPAAFVRHRTFDRMHGSFDVFRPYSYLFSYNYGGGLGAYNLSGDGYLRDAFVLAARLDYAVASNLNVFGAFFQANRTSHGYSWGCIGPNAGLVGSAFASAPDGNINIALNRYAAAPNIPDTSLGYEIDLGFDWKLLENFTGGFLLGYWQPGKWFSYACIDRSIPAWHTGGPGNNFGVRPNRTIDPVVGGNVFLKMDF